MTTLTALTLQDLIQRLRTQLRRYVPNWQIDPDEARSYVNLAYLYYLLRLGTVRETDLIQRADAVDIETGVANYALPANILLVSAVVVSYNDREFYLLRQEPRGGSVPVGSTTYNIGEWSPTAKITGRTVTLIPSCPIDIAGGLIIEGTTFPGLLIAPTDAIDSILHPAFHPLIELRSVLFALKNANEEVHYSKVEKALTDMELMFDDLTANRSNLREVVEDAGYMEA